LDYYSRTVFEVTSGALGAQDALAAGGRYDKLVKDLGGPDVPALGFAMGAERALQAIEAAKKEVFHEEPLSIFVAALGEPAADRAFAMLQTLRQDPELIAKGAVIEGGFFEKKLGAQLAIADRQGASHSVILGEDEIRENEVTLRTMKTGAQERVPQKDVISRLLTHPPLA
jgi:histidyl-tRNA synthetase